MARTRPTPLDLSAGAAESAAAAEAAPIAFEASADQPPAALHRPPATRPDPAVQRLRPVADPTPDDGARTVWLLAAFAAALWAGGVAAFAVGFYNPQGLFTLAGLDKLALGLLAIAPIGLIVLCAYLLRLALRLSAQTRRQQEAVDRLLQPTLIAAAQAGGAVEKIRQEIDLAAEAAESARQTLGALGGALSAESQSLAQASEDAAAAARKLGETVGTERDQLVAVARSLDEHASSVGDAVTRQARMVAEASEMAQAQIREAEAALAGRASELTAAAGEAGEAARTVSGDLSRQTLRLETASTSLGDQMRAIENNLTRQRNALAELGAGLRRDQESFAAQAGEQRERLAETLAQARAGAAEIEESSARGGEALQAMIAEAAVHARELAGARLTGREPMETRPPDATAPAFAAPEPDEPSTEAIDASLFEDPAPPPEAEPEQEPGPINYAAEEVGLRPRLRFTATGAFAAPDRVPPASEESLARPEPAPDAADAPLSTQPAADAPPEPAAEAPPPQEPADEARGDEDWSWRDLLKTMDGPPADEEALADRLASELGSLRINPAVLLPPARIDEIAAAVHAEDHAGARQVVARLAPAARTRLKRRLTTDAALHGAAEHFLEGYRARLQEASQLDRAGHATAELLGASAGRTYLLFDAAFHG